MKILCICQKAHPCCLGGIETFNRNLKKMYPEEIAFFTDKTRNKKYFMVDDVLEVDIKNPWNKLLMHLMGRDNFFYSKIKKIDCNYYIINRPKELRILRKDKKAILVQHANYKKYVEIYLEDNTLINDLKKNLNCFVFLSKYDKEKFIKELNFPREKTSVIRHTSEMILLQDKKIKNRNLIMICRLDNTQKRIDLAINAMKKLQDFILNIYGDGEDKEYLENLIKEKNLKNVFLYEGTNQVKEKLDENGIFIMTSDFEGYPLTTIEAMRRGLPIVLRNTFDSAPDIVQDNGILLDKEWNEDKFAEAVRKVYDNYDYYSENSIRMGKRHDFEVIKKEWEKLFESLAKE